MSRVVSTACLSAPCLPAVTEGAPLSTSGTLVSGSNALKYELYGKSAPLSLGAGATVDLVRGTSGTGWAFVSAQAVDIVTVEFAPFTGQIGYWLSSYALSGTIGESGIVNAEAELMLGLDDLGPGEGLAGQISTTVFTGSSCCFAYSPFFKFVYGSPFNFKTQLDVAVGTIAFGGTPTHLTAGVGPARPPTRWSPQRTLAVSPSNHPVVV